MWDVRHRRHDRRRHLTPQHALRAAAARRRPDDDRRRRPVGPRSSASTSCSSPTTSAATGARCCPSAAAAAATERIRLGTFVLNASFYHPLLLAGRSLTLDHLSGGRVELGLGAGHTPAEFAAPGVPLLPGRPSARPGWPRSSRSIRRLLDGETVDARRLRRGRRPPAGAAADPRRRQRAPACSSTPPATPTSSASPASAAPCPTATATPLASSRRSLDEEVDVVRRSGRRPAGRAQRAGPGRDVTDDREAAAAAPGGTHRGPHGRRCADHAVPRPRHARRDRRPPPQRTSSAGASPTSWSARPRTSLP